MVDIIDNATDEIILSQQEHISQMRRKVAVSEKVSSQFCIECGEPIPIARQRVIPGCRLCVDCQENKEKKQNEFQG